jgi:hypothetical protein
MAVIPRLVLQKHFPAIARASNLKCFIDRRVHSLLAFTRLRVFTHHKGE